MKINSANPEVTLVINFRSMLYGEVKFENLHVFFFFFPVRITLSIALDCFKELADYICT